MNERVAVVTGANRGIGRAIAEGMARADFRTVLVCRRREDGERAMEEIASRTGNHALEVMTADLSSLAEVRRLGDELLARFPAVHVLVNNAAVASQATPGKRRRHRADAGRQSPGAFRADAPAAARARAGRPVARGHRVIGGTAADRSSCSMTCRMSGGATAGVRVYGETKLMNVLFTRELARRTGGHRCHGHLLPSGGHRHPAGARLPAGAAAAAGRRVWPARREQGADTAVWLATSPEVAGATGGYYIGRRPARTNPLADDAELARRLWTESEAADLARRRLTTSCRVRSPRSVLFRSAPARSFASARP